MEIRKKISFQFIAIVAFILIISLLAIYISFSKYRQDEFYERLSNKARAVGQLLIEIDEIDSDLLKKIEKNNPTSLANEKIIIYNEVNHIIFCSEEKNQFHFQNDIIAQVKKEGEIKFRQQSYEIVGILYASEREKVVIFIAATDIYGFRKMKNLRIIMIIVFCISLIVVYFAGRFFASRSLKPIVKVINQVDKIGITNLNNRVDEGEGRDEITKLAKTFNKMLERLEDAFKMQKNFIANASHELRTPLTVITGQLDVVLMSDRSDEEYRNAISSALDEISNLNQLSNKLLMLAQASSDFSGMNYSKIRIDDVIWQARQDVLKGNKNFIINLDFDNNLDSEEKLTIVGNEILIRAAINNLIDNGCKYSHDNKVNVTISSIDSEIIIKFFDNGIGIKKEDISLIFEPFYRAKNATSTKGHGIGLSLVQKIIFLHNGKISVNSVPDKGSEFIITLPLYSPR
ncbi:MAG: HAMP domain-containing histidine kinase [Bacteroidia bacterium]|nr:HAMP domain-containing histidine kinase [Bacteroidia bacterium]